MQRNTKERKRLSKLERDVIDGHRTLVADMGCILTGKYPATLHHCHGGSLKDNGIHRGMGQRPSEFLIIPLIADLHTGRDGIDSGMGVRTWERKYGTQMDHLREVSRRVKYNVFELAGYDIEVGPRRQLPARVLPDPMTVISESSISCSAEWGGYQIRAHRSGLNRSWHAEVRTARGRMAFEGQLLGSAESTGRQAASMALQERWA